jgi:hypothetical protein
MLSQIFGNLLAAFIIDSLSQITYFYIMTGVCVASCLIFGTLKKPASHSKYVNIRDSSKISNDRMVIQAASTMIEPETLESPEKIKEED